MGQHSRVACLDRLRMHVHKFLLNLVWQPFPAWHVCVDDDYERRHQIQAQKCAMLYCCF